jgi:hypothetical protein
VTTGGTRENKGNRRKGRETAEKQKIKIKDNKIKTKK